MNYMFRRISGHRQVHNLSLKRIKEEFYITCDLHGVYVFLSMFQRTTLNLRMIRYTSKHVGLYNK